ncbi:hypothetical protein V3C99_006355, partial [Haemonchus contortus]
WTHVRSGRRDRSCDMRCRRFLACATASTSIQSCWGFRRATERSSTLPTTRLRLFSRLMNGFEKLPI